jgi:hypothetical protein
MKRRLITAAIALVPSIYLSLIGAYNLHFLLTGHPNWTPNPIIALAILGIPKAQTLFLLLFAMFLLGIAWMVFGREYIKYRSDMYQVTPDIKIPRPEGQGQYGTAWWLDPKKFDQTFATAKIDTKSELITSLINSGYDDLKED